MTEVFLYAAWSGRGDGSSCWLGNLAWRNGSSVRKNGFCSVDPANFSYGGEDPYKALLQIEDRIKYTHWKDVAHTDKGVEYRAFGEGDIDWPPIISKLLKSFKGLWSIEYERKVNSTLETLMDGTRTSCENLQRMIYEVEEK